MKDRKNPPTPDNLEQIRRGLGSRRALAPYLAEDFSAFCQRAWHVIDGSKLNWNWHHQLICEYLTLARRRTIKRLAISMPPRALKSRLVSCFFPAWVWTTAPHQSFLCASFSLELSTELSIVRRSLLESDWYSALFPGVVQLRPDANRVDDYTNSTYGRMIATGMNNVVGRGANYAIIDDPLTPKQAHSEIERASTIRAYHSGLRSRLNDPENDVIIVIQQRLHRGDLIGTIQDSPEASDWTFLSLPMVATEDQTITFPMSGKVMHRAKGDLLQPERWSRQWCEREAEGDPHVWSAQYLQSPCDPSHSILKSEWFKYWIHPGMLEKPEGALLLPETFDEVVIAGDLAFTATQNSDRVCIGAWGHKGNFKYLLDLAWARMDFTETVKAIRDLVRRHPNYSKIYIEKAANGAALISALENEVPGIAGVPASGSKVARYHAVSGQLSRGEVVVPHPTLCARTREFVSECAHAGIGGRFDDAADMMALALAQMAASAGYGPVIVIDRANRFQQVRDYLDGIERREVDLGFGRAITENTQDNDALRFDRFLSELFDVDDEKNGDQ
jgi:predicted phage terminase large subunit-like protein